MHWPKEVPHVQLLLSISLPIVGILFFDWNVADIYYLFFMELLFLGFFTSLKIMVSVNNGHFFERAMQVLVFARALEAAELGDSNEDEAAHRMIGLLFVLLVILLPLGAMMRSGDRNIALGISVILAKNLVDLFLIERSHRRPFFEKSFQPRARRGR